MNFYPRPGQWCVFTAKLPDYILNRHKAGLPKVHRLPDGRFVGIFRPGRSIGAVVNGKAEPPLPPAVMLCDENGNNVLAMVPDGGVQPIGISPGALSDLEPMTDKAHFPPGYVGNTAEHPKP